MRYKVVKEFEVEAASEVEAAKAMARAFLPYEEGVLDSLYTVYLTYSDGFQSVTKVDLSKKVGRNILSIHFEPPEKEKGEG